MTVVARPNPSVYYMMVASLNISYLRFFAASIVLHFALFFLVNSAPSLRIRESETIPVSILDASEREQPAQAPRMPHTRSRNTSAMIAKKDSPRLPAKTEPTKDRKIA